MARSSWIFAERVRFVVSRLKERLWIKPFLLCVLSVGATFLALLADDVGLAGILPEISRDSVESLLTVMASSMLVIATFAVGSMVAAYASASTGATPRSFPLVIADDVTQNALSAFIGAFIFSLVSLISVKNALFDAAGLFAIFAMTVVVFAIVIGMFVRWVDRIARLGRVVNTIAKVEQAAADALERRRLAPALGAMPLAPGEDPDEGIAVHSSTVGYVQHIDMELLQSCAENCDCRVRVAALPGTFITPARPLLRVTRSESFDTESFEPDDFSQAFTIGRNRTFEDDPRFGLLALSEIADKALSPGVNDPGTAIDVIGTMVRLFTLWQRPLDPEESLEINFDRVSAPELSIDDLFDDAFTAIARDGAGIVEVEVRLQKAFGALAEIDDQAMASAARTHSRIAVARAENAMTCPTDIEATRNAAAFSAET